MKTFIRRALLASALFASIESNAAPTEFTLPTAADGDVSFPMNPETRMPMSASDQKAEVTKAALTFLPKAAGQPLKFTWQYAIRFKTEAVVRSITIENERDKKLELLVQDDAPKIQSLTWTANEPSHEVTRGFINAVNAKGPWVLLRRVSIVYADGSTSKLHQMVLMTQPMRVQLMEDTARALDASK